MPVQESVPTGALRLSIIYQLKSLVPKAGAFTNHVTAPHEADIQRKTQQKAVTFPETLD